MSRHDSGREYVALFALVFARLIAVGLLVASIALLMRGYAEGS